MRIVLKTKGEAVDFLPPLERICRSQDGDFEAHQVLNQRLSEQFFATVPQAGRPYAFSGTKNGLR
jgi:hypothetical protein